MFKNIPESVTKYFFNVLTLVSQTFNAVVLFGNPNETISARGFRNTDKWWGAATVTVIDFIFFWQDEHCYQRHMKDVAFARKILNIKQ